MSPSFLIASHKAARVQRTGRLLAGALAAALAMQAVPAGAQSIQYPTQSHYSMPKPHPFTAKKADIDQLDADTEILVQQLRAGSPTAVEYAGRAHGLLIFPSVQTANYFLLGETKAFGVLYVRDGSGEFRKNGYYFGERNSLGFVSGAQASSRVLMFMNEDVLADFVAASDVSSSYMVVNHETGEVAGEPDADIAIMITHVEGDVSELSIKGLNIVPVDIKD
ncbi:hypothetical protein LNKW23_31980 [Paralimibaculum aggregatum]|uniref:Ysc84 actin-binding domain-containing protein n=1 Tax=Paralimibaculum aggregatum TaxID=3036245 RepID=A0ABQ6LRH1_9RHOB|nr:hypothetical protein [Limibaculum sp. NKW23]GMG83984.1 hypothetical protein LNKW23_31980 [Limibaculum sp. NKW23]